MTTQYESLAENNREYLYVFNTNMIESLITHRFRFEDLAQMNSEKARCFANPRLLPHVKLLQQDLQRTQSRQFANKKNYGL